MDDSFRMIETKLACAKYSSMIVFNYLYITAMAIALLGWGISAHADDDVTVVAPPQTTTTSSQKTVASNGSEVVHKSLHKKKKTVPAADSTVAATSTSPPVATAPKATAETKTVQKKPAVAAAPTVTMPAPAAPIQVPVVVVAPARTPVPAPIIRGTLTADPAPSQSLSPATGPTSLVPTVETGLPVARYPGMGSPIKGVSTYVPANLILSSGKPLTGSTTHQPYYAGALPPSVISLTSSAAGSFSTPSRTTTPSSDFVFTNYSHKTRVTYPWKSGIITTMFWIGEGGSNISSTDNIGSAWDEHWRTSNRGTDDPNDRNGYSPADHAPTVNPFYVALPFNDLAFPDKARQWLPAGWYRRPEDGKQVSACKDRWVEIKNAQGRPCYAQWEDVGPLRYDHAEYVFGPERPDTYTRAGLDVSPAVAQYLDIDGGKRAITSWRFVDDEDVPPGAWLKYDEQAVIYTALHQMRNSKPSSVDLPIQRATEPIEDSSSIDSNKKKVDASKG
jgi:hypothetical protein